MTTLMEKVRGVFSQREALQVRGYDELVQRAATGADIDAGEVTAVLDATGMSPDDFEKAVQLLRNREQWQEQVDSLPGLQQAACEIEGKLKENAIADAQAVTDLRRRQQIESRELNRQLGVIMDKINATHECHTLLHKNKPDSVKAAEAATTSKVRRLMAERDAIKEDQAVVRDITHGNAGGRGRNYAAAEVRVAAIEAEIQELQGSQS